MNSVVQLENSLYLRMTLNKLASFNDRFPVSLKTFDKVKPRDFFCALSKSVTHGSELKTKVSKLQKTFVFCFVLFL